MQQLPGLEFSRLESWSRDVDSIFEVLVLVSVLKGQCLGLGLEHLRLDLGVCTGVNYKSIYMHIADLCRRIVCERVLLHFMGYPVVRQVIIIIAIFSECWSSRDLSLGLETQFLKSWSRS